MKDKILRFNLLKEKLMTRLNPEIQTPERQTPWIQNYDIQTPGKQTPEIQTSERQIPERQTPEIQTSERQTPEKIKFSQNKMW